MAYTNIKSLTADGATLAPTTPTAIYTVPASTTAEIGTIILHNTNFSTESVFIFAGGTTDAHRVLFVALEAFETYEFSPKLPIVLTAGTSLLGLTTTASKVNVRLTGREDV